MSKNQFRSFDLEPRTAEEINECATPNGMRKRLWRYSYEHPLTRAIFQASDAQGLSGEDRMTWLAFDALRRLEKLENEALNYAMLNPAPPLITEKVIAIARLIAENYTRKMPDDHPRKGPNNYLRDALDAYDAAKLAQASEQNAAEDRLAEAERREGEKG